MKNIKLLISFFVFLPLITAAQGLDFTTVATPVFCVNDGSITVTVSNEVGHVQYELVNYSGITVRSVIGIPQDNPVFLNLAPGTYTVGVYDDNNGTTPITKQVVVPNNGPEKTLTISNVFSTRLAYCGTDSDPGTLMWVIPNGGAAPYTVTVLDTNDVVVREAVSSGSQSFPAMPAGTYKIRVKDNCGTVVNSNSPFVIAPNIVYDFTVSTPTNWYWPGAIQVTHDGAGSICDPVSDAYYDFSYAGGIGIPVITGNDVYPISLAPGIIPMYAVEYDGIKTAYMTRDELRTYKHPLPTDINSWKPMTLWVSNCGVEKSTVYNLPSRRNDFLPKPIENGAITFYVGDDAANTLCAPTGYVTLSRFSLLSGFCDPLTLTITEKNGAELPQQYTITSANQNDFEAQLALGNTYILKFTDANGSELNRFSYINVTRGQRVNLNSRSEIFIDPVNFRPANQDELSVELGSMADFKNFGRSQIGIRDYALPKPYTAAITGPNGFYMEKTVAKSDSFVGTLLSDNLVLGDYSVRVTSAATCYDKTFPITLDRVIDSISVTSTITPDPVACDRYIKTFEYKINNRGILRPYPTNAFEDVFKAPQLGFKVIDGPAGYTHTNAIVFNSAYSWGMSSTPEVTATFRGDITGLYKINLVDYYTPTNVIGGPWELNVKSEFPVFDMNGSGGAICTGATTGTLSVVVKNATSPVYYLKKASDANYPATGQSSSDFPNLTAGDYMVKVETACYPTALETNFKMDYISNIGNIIQGTNNLCDSDALNLSLKSIGPITSAEWKLPDGTTQTGSSLVLTNPQAGQYEVKVTTRSGCVVTDVIEVKLKNRAVLADVLATDKTICSGETTTLQATSTTITNPLFTWYSDAGLTNVLSTGADYNTPVLTANTTYYVTVQNTDVCESIPTEARAVGVTLNPSATAADITADAVDTCVDDNATLNADSTTITNPVFTWYSDADLTDVLGVGTSFTTPELTTDKSYYVTVKGDNVCENSPGTAKEVHVTVHPALVVTPPTPQITGNQCVFPEINFDSNSAGTLYVWSVDDWTIGLEDNWISSPNMPSFTAINTGTQPVTATVTVHPIGTYCGAGSFTFTITVNPDIVLTKPADIKVCNDNIVSEINFDSNITGTTYSWTNDNPRIGLATVGTGNIPAFTASNTGDSSEIATITVTPTASGCSGTPVVFTIEVNPAGAMNKIADQNICIGETTILTASSATVINPVFTWYSDAALTNVLAVDAAYNANPLVTTTYYVTVKGENACETTTGMPVVVRVSDAGTPTGSAAQEFCSASNALVSDLVTNESNVTWYDAANGGNVISAGTALVNRTVYYGSLTAGTCESITRLAVTAIINDAGTPTGSATQEFCSASNALVSDLVTNESNVTWYDAANGGNVVSAGRALVNGTIYYGSLAAGTCESITRLAVTAIINDAGTPTGNTTQEFCSTSNALVSDLVTNESNVTWYDAANGGNVVSAGTPLVNGTIYYGSLAAGTCESITRLAVTAIINNVGTPTGSATQEFCSASNALVSDLVTNESNVTWYDAANDGNVISAGTVLVNGTVYYGSLAAGTCESITRLAVTAILNNAGIPTGNATQEFCLASNALVSDLVTNENNVTWYDAANGGNVVSAGTTLVNGTVYYGSLTAGTCESITRLTVTAILNNAGTPTGNATQEFCSTSNALVSDLVTNESNVTWYDSANGGNVVSAGTTLVNGTVYYGSLTAGTCESITRLAVLAIINNAGTPTGSATQEFCSASNALVSDLVTNESNVTWYDAANGGNVISAGTALVNGTVYYGSLTTGTCESITRLAVTAIINNAGTPTGNATQEFCSTSNALVSDLVTNENNVTWYDAANGGNVVSAGTMLVNGTIYYGSLTTGTCESITRLAVTVIINDAGTLTGSAVQEFCLTSNALVSDLVTNESNVTWYDAANGGNVVSAGTALVNGTVYYGSLTVGTCESITRLAVTAILNNAGAPTGNAAQEFCSTSNALVSDLVTNENNVTWYDAENGGNVVSAGTTLVNGTVYYGSLTTGICESITRLAVTVIIKNDLPGENIGWKATACIAEEVTYKTTSAMSDYNWMVTGGSIKAGGQLKDDFVTVIWTTAGNGAVQVEFIDSSNCNPIVAIHFPVSVTVCSDIAIGKTVNNPTPAIGENVIFTVTATNIGASDFQHVSIDEMLPSGYSYVIATTTSGNYNSSNGVWDLPVLAAGTTETLTLTAKVKGTGDYLNIANLNASTPADPNLDNNRAEAAVTPTGIVIYNAVSANGDGINDYFKIEGLDRYSENSVEIYNRWGVKIFETSGYGSNGNVFRGTSDGRTTVQKGNVVPAGTYFYILRYQTNAETRMEKSGYLYVN